MRLKKLAISGFKSFADKTILEFDDGITSVVGPNGCGKSNIVDAFRWVMGEQSAKSIRGDKMLDIIFAGTDKRKPLNIAEVTLTFDNENGVLPIEYQEVSISRKVYRSGESEYLINKKVVRLKDIESLFWDTGLGRDAFCIFEQGKIDQVIHYSPVERRTIFEEASGILRFKQRRRETLKRLELADQNLLRAQDIYKMVSAQKDSLEKQSKEAIIYKDRKSSLEKYEKLFLVKRHSLVNEKLTLHEKNLEHFLKEIQKEKEAILIFEEKVKSAKSTQQEHEIALQAHKEHFFQLKSEEKVMATQLLHAEDGIKEKDKRLEKLQEENKGLQEKLKVSRTQFLQDQEKHNLPEEAERLTEKAFHESKEIYEKLVKEKDAMNLQERALQQDLLQLTQSETRFKNEEQTMRLKKENSEARISYLHGDIERLKKVKGEYVVLENEKRALFDSLSKEIDLKKKEHQIITTELIETDKRLDLLRFDEKDLQKKFNEFQARKKVLSSLKEDFEGISKGSKRLLQESKQPKSALYGKIKPLYELICSKKGYEKALSSSLGNYSDTLVIETKADLELVLAFTAQNSIKDFSVFCMEDLDQVSNSCEGSILNQIVASNVAPHFLKEISLGGDREPYVTKEGIFKDKLKVLFSPSHGEKNTFLRESEIHSISQQLEEINDAIAAIEKTLKDSIFSKEAKRREQQELEKIIRSLEMKHVEANFGLQRAISDKSRADGEIQKHETDLKVLQISSQEIAAHLEEFTKKDKHFKTELESKQAQLKQLADKHEKIKELNAKADSDLKEKENAYKQLLEMRQKKIQLEQLFEATSTALKQQEVRLQNEVEGILEQKKLLTEQITTYKSSIVKLAEELALKLIAQKEFENAIAEKIKLVTQCENELKEQQKKIFAIDQKRHKEELLFVQEKSSLSAIVEQAETEFQKGIDILSSEIQETQESVEELVKKIKAIKSDLELMQDINLSSIDEFEAQKEQEKFLSEQLLDLTGSKQELLEILNKLDTESKKLFTDTFEKIRANFRKNFQILFEGGEADLTFTDNEDILEAGIEISARPPGKQMRSISLLSGGEKCLTALALLFGIFEVKPAAFCLLDEVDAPLDEMNVDRFTRMIKLFAEKTQFIVITHNKRTMSVADRLFGISMEEKGVSKLLSLVFEDNYANSH